MDHTIVPNFGVCINFHTGMDDRIVTDHNIIANVSMGINFYIVS